MRREFSFGRRRNHILKRRTRKHVHQLSPGIVPWMSLASSVFLSFWTFRTILRISPFPGLDRHDTGSPSGRRSQNPVIPHEIEPRRGHQGGKLADKIQRVEYHIRGPVAPAMPQPVHHPSVRQPRQSFRRHCRPRHIATQIFQLAPRLGGNVHSGMQAESR